MWRRGVRCVLFEKYFPQTSTKNRQLRETAALLQNWCLKADQETSHLLKEATNNFVLSNATDEDREVKERMKQQKKHR